MSEQPTSAFDGVRDELVEHRRDALLLAAHEAEFVPDGEPASDAVRHALAAACNEGKAIGIAMAITLLEQPESS